MIRTGWLGILVVALAPWPCPAQIGGMVGGMGGGMGGEGPPTEEWTVKFETDDGQGVTGKLRLSSVGVACTLGLYEIKPGKIKSVQFGPAGEPAIHSPSGVDREGAVLTGSGEKIAGRITIPHWWKVETELGTLSPNPQHLKTMTFVARLDDPARPEDDSRRPPPGRPGRRPRPGDGPAAKEARPGDGPAAKEARPGDDPAAKEARPGDPGPKP